jgi:two-component system response regulator AtoC
MHRRIERILVQDEEGWIPRFLKEGDITTAKNSQSAIELLKEKSFDFVICDEIEVLKRAKALYPQAVVVVVTAFASVENAIEAMRHGAFDYLVKNDVPLLLETILERAEEHLAFKQEISFQNRGKMEQIMAESSVMKQVLSDIGKVSKSHASVFISGESGTGKEVIAHAIHFQSPRSSQPFIKVNCAAIPETLIESEFFGHEKGSFTGAIDKRLGRFELANKGTLLLDEVSEIPLTVQAKLLRVVQEQEFERVGGVKPIKVDVRLISTSNRNMKETVEQKLFREDLYYRLNVVPIHLPPLRQRKEDILSLARYFLERLCEENHKKTKKLSSEAEKKLLEYYWPGNIRELANIIERTIVMDAGATIEPDHLKIEIACPVPERKGSAPEATLAEVEKNHILETLRLTKNNRTQTAKKLGISIRTLRNKLKEYSGASQYTL